MPDSLMAILASAPSGFGSLLGSFTTGGLLLWIDRRRRRKHEQALRALIWRPRLTWDADLQLFRITRPDRSECYTSSRELARYALEQAKEVRPC